jgi:hypothetical protein
MWKLDNWADLNKKGHNLLFQKVIFWSRHTDSNSYQGDVRVTVLSIAPPNGVALILLDGAFYVVDSVISADALQATVKYACNALPVTDAPNIRNA